MVHALPGQRLNFTLYKFGHQTSILDVVHSICPIKVTFKEADGSVKDVSLCSLGHREQVVYSSASSVASVFIHYMAEPVYQDDDDRLLMKIEGKAKQ